jgi:aryl-alcohol dehydrogenase-like predicted oxidoreductase
LVSSAIGLGTRAFIDGRGDIGGHLATIRLALRIGITLFDTADFYAGGEIERLLGAALSRGRAGVVIATSGGVRFTAGGRPAGIDGSPAYLGDACDASLRRLGTDHIDLFSLSRVDPRVPVEESVGKLADLVAAGKIRYVGLCGASADELRRAHAVHPVSVLAAEYSLWRHSVESGSLVAAAELGVGLVACSPLARGALTGRRPYAGPPGGAEPPHHDPLLSTGIDADIDPGAGPDIGACDPAALRALEAEAADLDLGTTRLALAWLLSRRPDIVPVPSTRNPVHLEINAAAVGIRLPPAVCDRLAGLFPHPPAPERP